MSFSIWQPAYLLDENTNKTQLDLEEMLYYSAMQMMDSRHSHVLPVTGFSRIKHKLREPEDTNADCSSKQHV